jgi:TolB-like protein/Tfp pilus assembly protein PilF
MRSLFSELRRRNVYRAAAFYAAAGWLLVQIATQVFPFYELPNWTVRLVIAVVVLGFPFAMALAWFYEWTPQGIKRESQVAHSPDLTRAAGRKYDRWIIAVLSVAIVLLLANQFVLHKDSPAMPEKSIAVLPFENLSEDPANSYFAAGIQDEILARLTKIGQLKVISRTSTQQYASKPANLGEIARQLGVANILEGSVQKSAGTVHITVQLISAASDNHLWAESYDRKLDDVFGVEGEVAGAIAQTLKAKLSGDEQQALADGGTDNAQAHDAFLLGLSLKQRVSDDSPDGVRRTRDQFAQAVKLDPKFALAWAHLSMIQSFMYFNSIDRSPQLLNDAKSAAETAMVLLPELGEGYLALGYYRYWGLRDFDSGLQAFEQAQRRLPNNTEVMGAIGLIERRQGHWQASLEHSERAVSLDPRNTWWLENLANDYSSLHDYPQALATLDRALEIQPNDPALIAAKADVYQAQGDLDAAQSLLDPLSFDPKIPSVFEIKIWQLLLRRDPATAVSHLQHALRDDETSKSTLRGPHYLDLALAEHMLGDTEATHDALAKALEALTALPPSEQGDSRVIAYYAMAHAGLGDKETALREANRAMAANDNDAITRPKSEVTLANVYALLGDNDDAIALLTHLIDVPNGLTPGILKTNPLWDSLRSDPRFQKLVNDGDNFRKDAKP